MGQIYVIFFLIIVWTIVPVLSYEVFSKAKNNHLKFRYWFSIGMLTMFQLLLGALYILEINTELQSVRWIAFVFIDWMLLEIFIVAIIQRKIELFTRVIFFTLLLLDTVVVSFIPLFLVACILTVLAYKSKCVITSEHFRYTFILYMGAIIAPHIFGFTSIESLLIGLVYSIHLVWGFIKIYNLEWKEVC